MRKKIEVGFRHSGKWRDERGKPCDPPKGKVSSWLLNGKMTQPVDDEGAEVHFAPLRKRDFGFPCQVIEFEPFTDEMTTETPVRIGSRTDRDVFRKLTGTITKEKGMPLGAGRKTVRTNGSRQFIRIGEEIRQKVYHGKIVSVGEFSEAHRPKE